MESPCETCTLLYPAGKEHFPSAWPNEVLELFRMLLSDGVLATVEAFDGHSNLLSVTLDTESGGGHLNAIILEGLQAQANSPPAPPPTPELQPTENSTASAPATATPAAAPEHPKPSPTAETMEEPASPASTLGLMHTVQHSAKVPAASVNGWSHNSSLIPGLGFRRNLLDFFFLVLPFTFWFYCSCKQDGLGSFSLFYFVFF